MVLSEEDVGILYTVLGGGAANETLVQKRGADIELSRKALSCLEFGEWLNDEVINYAMHLLHVIGSTNLTFLDSSILLHSEMLKLSTRSSCPSCLEND
jgi:hypothetical protein